MYEFSYIILNKNNSDGLSNNKCSNDCFFNIKYVKKFLKEREILPGLTFSSFV